MQNLSASYTRNPWLHPFFLLLLLSYPVMGSKIFPFGGGGRYMSVLAGPAILLLLLAHYKDGIFEKLGRSSWKWISPFIPFVLTWEFVQFWHHLTPIDSAPLSRILWGVVLYAGARYLNLTRRQLAYAACLGACAYCAIAMVEFFLLGHTRVGGGVYLNRFGQFSSWLAGLCILHFLFRTKEKPDAILNYLAPLSCLLALAATVLSGSRGALIALPALLLVALIAGKQYRKQALAATAFLITLTAFSILLYPMTQSRAEIAYREFVQYFNQPIFTGTSIGIRLEMWRIALTVLAENPLFGAGFTSFADLRATHPALIIPDELLTFSDFHSDWGKIIGLGGGLLLVSFLTSIILLCRQAGTDGYRLWGLSAGLIFSLAELFFCDKIGFSFFVATWALYTAAHDNTASHP